MSPIHKTLTVNSWQKLSFAEQLGNIGSELSRARSWEEKGDLTAHNKSLERALELLDLSLQQSPNQAVSRELSRLREILADIFSQTYSYHISLKKLEQYCLPFAILARKNH